MSPEKKKQKVLPLGGAVLGAVTGLLSVLSMDIFYSDALQGTWRDAISRDMRTGLSIALSPESPAVLLVYILIILLIMAFGALSGYIFGCIVQRIFLLLDSGHG